MTQTSNELLTQLLLTVREAATTDPVTKIPNRLSAFQHLAALRCDDVTLGMIDLDHFKRFNDEHGHEVGDQVLWHAANVLRRAIQEDGGELFRIGGEEFLAVMPGLKRHAPNHWRSALAQSLTTNSLRVTASIGVATGAPSEHAELLKRADAACYRAKAEGRNRVCFDCPDQEDRSMHAGERRVRSSTRAPSRSEFDVTPLDGEPRFVIAASPEAAVRGLHEALGVSGWIRVSDSHEPGSQWLLHVDSSGTISDFTPWQDSVIAPSKCLEPGLLGSN